MYVNSGYLFHQRTPFKERKRPLRILSAGTYRVYSLPKLPTWRPRGRVDWQLLYVSAGKLYCVWEGKEVVVDAGNMLLFQPKQEQHYYAKGEDKTQYWFVHFTGGQVKNILKHFEIPLNRLILHTGISRAYEDLFRGMRDELVNCPWGYEEMLKLQLQELFMTIHRRMSSDKPQLSGFLLDEVNYAREYFGEHYREEINISQYADGRHMSVSWFTKNFKKIVGVSPLQYILNIRIANAQTLLETTDYGIAQIARFVGYENPMYFSRIFRKEKGMSPANYRKTFLEQHPGQ